MPLRAHQHNAGWVFGHTFIQFTHVGRTTGRPHDTVAMLLNYGEATREAVICAAWGPGHRLALQAVPATTVRLGPDGYAPQQRFLSVDEALDVAVAFRRRQHPHRLHVLQSVLGWGDLDNVAALREFVTGHPMVAFRPKSAG
jgi:hypothetical protein